MADIVIIGNSGAARECRDILEDMRNADPEFAGQNHFKGYLAWQGHPGSLGADMPFFLGDAENYGIGPHDLFIIGIGSPLLRQAVFATFRARGASFMNLVHPLADMAPSARLGTANIFQRGSFVLSNASIGDGNYFNGFVGAAHDAQIGNFNFFAPMTMLLGKCRVGSLNHFAPASILLDKASVGNGNLVSPGSIIYKGCRDKCRMAGNPALKIGTLP